MTYDPNYGPPDSTGARPFQPPPYEPAPYEPAPYQPPPYQPAPPVPGYQYPAGAWPGFGFQPNRAARVTAPVIGWLLLVVGAAMVAGGVLPWATYLHASVAGTQGDGTITLAIGAALCVLGAMIGLRQGRLWAPILVCVASTFTTLTSAVDMGNVASLVGGGASVSIGIGLYLTLATGLAAAALGIAGFVYRS